MAFSSLSESEESWLGPNLLRWLPKRAQGEEAAVDPKVDATIDLEVLRHWGLLMLCLVAFN
ncbi:hypothetical protein CEP53_011739, partial [Fusarium sp. AF-6]